MPEEKDKIKLMYDAMSPKIELGTPQQFEEILKDKTKRNLLYQKASQSFELGGENDFNNLVDAELNKKKSSGTGSSDSGPKVGPLQSGLRSNQGNSLWPQLELDAPTTGPLKDGLKAGIPWTQLDAKNEQDGIAPAFTPKPVETFDPEKFVVKVQSSIPDAIDPNKGLGEKINKDVEKTTNIMNTYKSAIGNLEGKINADIASRDSVVKELKDLQGGIKQIGTPKTKEEAMALQGMYEQYNLKVDALKTIQEDAEKKYATYQTVSKGYERRVKEMDPLMRTQTEDESEWLPYWDKVGAPMVGAFIASIPNQLIRTMAMGPNMNNPVAVMDGLNAANKVIEATGLSKLDDLAKRQVLVSEKNAMKLRIREGTDLETLFKGDLESLKGNAGKIVDLAFKQAIASAPITFAALGATAFGGMGAGAAMTFLGTGGMKYASLKDRTDMSEADKMMLASFDGAFETAFEFLPDVLNAKIVVNSFMGMGKKATANQVKKSLTDNFFDAYGKFFPITAPLGEGLGEVFTGAGQRYSDTLFDPQYAKLSEKEKTNYIFGENFSKSKGEFASGTAGATFFVAPQLVAETVQGIRDPKLREKVKELFTKKQAVQADIDSGKLTGMAAEVATEEVSNINSQISEVVKKNTEAGEAISIDQKGAAEQINEQIDAITETLTTNTEISPETVAALETKKDDLVKQVKEITTKVNLLEDIKIQEDAAIQSGLEEKQPTEIVGQEVEKPGSGTESGGKDKGNTGQVEEVVKEQPKSDANAKLPNDLKGAKPRYSYGSKQFEVSFESDIDKAAYIAAQEKPSKRDADYLSFAMKATGMTEKEVREHGANVRSYIKGIAKDSEPGILNIGKVELQKTISSEKSENPINLETQKPNLPEGFSYLPDEVIENLPPHKTGKIVQGHDNRLSELNAEVDDEVLNSYTGKVEKIIKIGPPDKNGYPTYYFESGGTESERPIYQLVNPYETNTGTEERSTEVIIAESEAIESEAADHKPGQSSKSILQKLEDQINSINAKIVKLTETWDEDQLPEDEQAGRQAGKAAKKEVRKYAGEVAKILGWTASKVNDNIAPAGGDVTYRLEIPDTPLEIYVAVKYEPDMENGGYGIYKIDQFFYRVEKPTVKGMDQYVGQNQWMFFNKPQFGLKQEASIPTPKEFAMILAKEAAPYIQKSVETPKQPFQNVRTSQEQAQEAIKNIVEASGAPKGNVLVGGIKPVTQEEKVKEVLAGTDEGKSIKEIAEATGILEPNVRRILGVGAKAGKFERVGPGVYVLKGADGKETAYIEAGDAKETLARFADEGRKFDMVFLDPAYFSRALIGGNRGIKEYSFIMPPDFEEVMKSVSKMVGDDNHVYVMLSGAETAQKDMVKYVDGVVNAGFKLIGEGGYQKTFKDGSPVTNVRGEIAKPERLMLFTKSGNARAGEIPVNLNFRFVRPSVKTSYQTEKPKELLRALIEQSTFEGETILDPFAGSGVTGEQAIETGRKPTLVEKNPDVVDNVIVPRVEGSKLKDRIKAIENKELDDLWDDFNKSTTTNTGLNPEQLAKAMKLTAKYIELGILKFADIVSDAYARFGADRLKEIFPGLKQAYGAYLMTDEADSIEGLSEPKEVKTFDLTNFIDKQNEQDNSAIPNGDGRNPSELDGRETATGAIEEVQGQQPEGLLEPEGEPSGGSDGTNGEGGEVRSGSTGDSKPNNPSTRSTGGKRAGGTTRKTTGTDKGVSRNINNFRISESDVIIPKGEMDKIKSNITAIKLAKLIQSENRPATDKEKSVLAKFVGWGGLATVLDESKFNRFYEQAWNDKYGKLHEEIKQILTPEEFNDAVNSTINAHYTDRSVIEAMWSLAERFGFKGGNIMEPGAGVGHFIGLMPKSISDKSLITAYELDSLTGLILSKLYPDAATRITGYENSVEANNSQDLIIANVPFGRTAPYDKNNQDLSKFNLHNYFIAKGIRQLKPGGIGMFITSSSSMDNAGSGIKFREWTQNNGNADFIGAVRLPNNAFDKNAGTQVTTDIMIYRKRATEQASELNQPYRYVLPLREAQNSEGKSTTIDINEYYINNPEMMLGEMFLASESGKGGLYNADAQTLMAPAGQKTIELLNERLKLFPENIFGAEASTRQAETEIAQATDKEGTLINKDGKLFLVENGSLVTPDWTYQDYKGKNPETGGTKTYKKGEVAKNYLEIKEAVRELISIEQQKNVDEDLLEEKRAILNAKYDKFVNRFGEFSRNRKIEFLEDDSEHNAVFALEDVRKNISFNTSGNVIRTYTIEKSPIFFKRVNFPVEEPATAENIGDAVNISISYRNKIDVPFISGLVGLTEDEVISELLSSGEAFENPDTGLLEDSNEYLSGFVRTKLRQAIAAAETNPQYNSNVKALEEVVPKDIPAQLIEFRLGSTWLPPSFVNDFIKETTGVSASISYSDISGRWTVGNESNTGDPRNKVTYGTNDFTAVELIEKALNLTQPTVSYTVKNPDGSKSSVKDVERTLEAQGKMQELADMFYNYIKSDKEKMIEIERVYNDVYRDFIEKKYTLPSFVYYPGASRDIKLNAHQRKGVVRATRDSVLLAHEVGTGKTFTIITTAMEWRRLGIAKKPMIVVQNATLEQFARDFKKLYPSANILAPTKKEMDAKNRQTLFNKIAYGDWDSVIIPQSFLDFIPDDEGRERAYLQEQIDEVQEALDEAIESDDRGAISELRRVAKSLDEKMDEIGKPKRKVKDKAKANLSATKAFLRQADRRKDDVLNFEKMGIDALVVDEAHNYKKLGFVSKMSRIKGIDVGRSKRAFGLFMKVRWVQEKNNGRNIVFATGTPITNTMAEAWTMMKFVAPEIIEKYNINTFDQFASTFGVVEPSLEFGPTGKFKMVERFKSYMNAPELLTAFRSKTDVVLTDDIPEFKESNSIPKLKIQDNGKPGFTAVYLDQTDQLKTTMGAFKKTLEDWEKMTGKEKKALSYLPLLIFNRAKQAAIDLRLIDPSAADDPGSKTNAVVREAKRIYDATSEYKGTQLIFSDMYQSPETKEKFLDEDGTILNPAYGLPRFNLYDEIKSKLVAQGIPENEIVVINDYEGDKRQFIFNQVKEGNVRILLGSTERMGVGVNVQDKLAALHHIDAPPRPMDFAQRNGRILRQGNTHAEMGLPVEILTYGVKKTLDATAYQRLEFKQKFINQMVKAEGVDRVMADEADEDNPSDMAFSQMMSTLSGSQYAILHTQRMYELRKLRTAKSNYERRLVELNDTVKNNYKIIDSLKAQRDNYLPFIENINKYFPEGKVTNVTVNEVTVSENMGDAVEVLVDKVKTKLKTTKAGTSIEESFEANGKTVVIHGTLYVGMNGIPTPYTTYTMGVEGSNSQFQGEINTGVGLMMSLNRKIKEATDKELVSEAIASFDKRIDRANETIEVSKDLLTKPFDKEDELIKKEAEVLDLEEKMKNETGEEEEGGGPDDSGPKPKGLADRGIDALERMKINPNNKMFGMLPPFALAIPMWNATVSLMQDAIRLGKMTHEIINVGLDYIRSQGVAFAHEQDFIDYFTSVLDGPPDQPEYTPQDVEDERQAVAQDLKQRYADLEKSLFGSATNTEADMQNMATYGSSLAGLVNRAQDRTLVNFKNYLGDKLATAYAKKAVSDSKLVRNAARSLSSLFANLGKTVEQQLKGESFVGNTEKGISDANEISKWLRHAIENNPESLLRIDQVLDPEFYNKMSLERFKSYLKDEIGEEDYNEIPAEQFPDWYAQYLLDIGYNENYKPTTIADLNPAELEVYTMIRNINNYLHDLNFVNGKMPYSTYLKNKGKYIARMYGVYELPQDANDLINNNNREYMNPFKKRGEITEWKVANRLSDPIYATTKRLYQSLANNAIYEYADFVLRQPGQVSRIELPGFTLMGKGYGKLTGRYVRNDIAEDFKGFFYANDQLNKFYDVLKDFDRWTPRQFYKKLFTVWNPGVHLGNLTSNYVFAYLSGINGARLSSNVPKAYKEIRDYGPMYRYLLSKGVLKSSLSRTDLANAITTLDKLTTEATESQSFWSKMAEIPGDVYAGVDDVYKIAAYISLLEEGMAPTMAVDRVMEGFQNYKRVGKTYDFTSKIPLIGKPFGKFAGDMLRIAKNAAMTRPLQAATFIATLHAIAYMASKMSGEDDMDRRIRASRPGFAKIPMPDFLGGDVELGYKVGDNEFNVARLITPLFIYSGVDDGDAYDAWQKFSPLPLQIDTWTQHPSGTGTVNFAKNFGSDPILSPVLQLWLNADFRGVPILDPKATKYEKSTLPEISITKLQGGERLTNAFGFLLRSYGGSAYALLDDLGAAAQGKEDYYGREKTPGQVVLRFLGVKVEKFPDTKYGKIMQSKLKSYNYQLEDNTKVYNKIRELYGLGEIDLETAQMRMVPVIEERAEIINKMKIDFGAK